MLLCNVIYLIPFIFLGYVMPKSCVIRIQSGSTIALDRLIYYFYERAKFFQQAEDKARAVGDRVYETGAGEATGNE